ncbi:MAG: CPBP family intramembrane glutamic endopeptidase [Bacteroidota bacterium]
MLSRLKEGFREIWQGLKAHFSENWHTAYYLSVVLMMSCYLIFNYFFLEKITVESWINRTFSKNHWGTFAFLAFYSLPYFGTLILYGLWQKDWAWARSRAFWIRSLFGLLLLSFDGAFYYYRHVGELATSYAMRYYLYKVSATFISVVAIFLPMWVFWRWYDKEQESFYGLRIQGFHWPPYLLMLGIMVPIVFAASFLPEFIDYYPTLKLRMVQRLESVPQSGAIALYELFYLLDFVWTELIFRGFFVIGMYGVLGPKAVLPMASLYVSRHFAKPMGESISSLFGGYILGILAYRSRNILGGILIHMGIAFLMEAFALLQWWLRN